jgi:hypothetical protein
MQIYMHVELLGESKPLSGSLSRAEPTKNRYLQRPQMPHGNRCLFSEHMIVISSQKDNCQSGNSESEDHADQQ